VHITGWLHVSCLLHHFPFLNKQCCALPSTAFTATSQAEPTTTDNCKINTQPTNKTATSNISSNGDSSISDHYQAYDPGSDRLNNTIEGTPVYDKGDSMCAMTVTTHTQQRQQHVHIKGNNTCTTKATTHAWQRQQHMHGK
jgi:hypothetical protein